MYQVLHTVFFFFWGHSPPFGVAVDTFVWCSCALAVTKHELVCEVNSKCSCYQPLNNNLMHNTFSLCLASACHSCYCVSTSLIRSAFSLIYFFGLPPTFGRFPYTSADLTKHSAPAFMFLLICVLIEC